MTSSNSTEKEKEIHADKTDYTIDFVTSSAISRISIKFLAIYIPILWVSGYMAVAVFFDVATLIDNWILTMFLLPFWLFILYFIFIFGIAIFSKAFLLIVNMVHKPREGVFRAEKGDQDFEFWRLRIELKKLALWLMNNSPLPWIVMWGFRWFGVRIDFSSHLQDAWVDTDFIEFGRNVTIGQGTVVMSSMVVGKYLIIKKVIFGDYTVAGGVSNIAPGTFLGDDSVTGAFTNTNFNQFIEPGWIYVGLPAMKYKPNKFAEQRRDRYFKKDVEEEITYEVQHDVNIDEDKKELVNNNKEGEI
ncbi:MAG: hypothetical protein ACFE8M_01190 [Candidatus Hermodarchaeota archaeon]